MGSESQQARTCAVDMSQLRRACGVPRRDAVSSEEVYRCSVAVRARDEEGCGVDVRARYVLEMWCGCESMG